MKHIGFFIMILSFFAMPAYPEGNEFYKEFRYRIEGAAEQSYNEEKTPPVKLFKSSSIILESRNVSARKSLGHGTWKKVSSIAVFQATERHIERIFMNLPRSWVEDGYHVFLMPTVDNRRYWWETDGTLHFYALYK
jgi:hypothetical protein